MATQLPGSNPSSKVATVDDPTLVGLVVVNPDGSSIGSGSGGSGATAANQVTQITAEQAIQAGVGATSDAAATSGSTGSLNAKLRLITSQLVGLVLGAGSAIIGKVGIDQTTPGTTDSVTVKNQKVGAATVVGITEVDAYVTGANSNHTISAGALAIAVNFSSDFTGTVQGATYTSANQGIALSRVAQPGNLLPAMAITISAGTFDYYVVTPT